MDLKELLRQASEINTKLRRENEALAAKLALCREHIKRTLDRDIRTCHDCQCERSGEGCGDEIPPPIGYDARCDECAVAANIRSAWRCDR